MRAATTSSSLARSRRIAQAQAATIASVAAVAARSQPSRCAVQGEGGRTTAMSAGDRSDAQIRAFQDAIFEEDRAILESQRPALLPLDPRAEASCAADRLSLAWRAWLRELGVGMVAYPHGQVRAVTHRGIDDADIEAILDASASALAATRP